MEVKHEQVLITTQKSVFWKLPSKINLMVQNISISMAVPQVSSSLLGLQLPKHKLAKLNKKSVKILSQFFSDYK